MSTPFLLTKPPSKWVLLLSVAALSSYPQLTEGLPLQQGPLPQETGLDHCESQRYEIHEEHCGSKIVQLPLCNPGQRRVWQCGPETLPDDFTPANLNIHTLCQSCPPYTFQKWYNTCSTCHSCTVCGEGETEDNACEMEEDTQCVKVSTGTGSLPVIATPLTEGTLNPTETTTPINLPSTPLLTDGVPLETKTASQTAPPIGESNDNPHSTTVWLYIVVALARLLLILLTVSIGYREWLKRRMPQAMNQDCNISLNPMYSCSGNVAHDNEREHEEGDPLLGARQQGEGAEPDIPVHGDAKYAVGPLAVHGIQRTKGPSDVVVDLGVGGRCAGTSEGAPCVGGYGSTGASGTATTPIGDIEADSKEGN